ncbi:MAG TPA: YihY/virulence factor BrkB family protein [Gemmatimonadaceae bacterium]|nr:YihY/virulence factor BrkB family protein [Gemmatimonadaceae bacterium]
MRRIKDFGRIVWLAAKEFSADGCGGMAAAASYYIVFALPALLALLALVMGWVMDPQEFREVLSKQVTGLIGPKGGDQIVQVLQAASTSNVRGIAAVIGVATLIASATGAFVQLQQALNTAWEVAPDPAKGGIMRLIRKRVTSLAMIGSIGFLLLASLGVSAMLAVAGGVLHHIAPSWIWHGALIALDIIVSLAIVSMMFSFVFRYVPDAEVRWRDALIGGLCTGALFTIGKFAIGYYLGRKDPGTVFGAAGSLALVLVWVNYSAMILFYGAEFTQVWAREHGARVQPDEGAVRVKKTLEIRNASGETKEVPQKQAPSTKGVAARASEHPYIRHRRRTRTTSHDSKH